MKVRELMAYLEMLVASNHSALDYDLLVEPKIMGTRSTAPLCSVKCDENDKDIHAVVIEYSDFGGKHD